MSDYNIFNYSFASAGRNKYYASEVDDFLRSIADSYETMQKNYKALEKKLKNLAPAVEEYNNNKSIIYSAIVRVESYVESVKSEAAEHSAEILKKASEEAETVLITKKAEADAYYYSTTHEADEKLGKLQQDIEALEKQSQALQEKYLSETKEKAAEIIDNAKTKAAEIVAAAYHDAKAAREQSEEIIASTEAELTRLKAEIARYKNEIFNVVATIRPAVESISDGAQFDFKPTEVEVDTDKLADELPEFELDVDYDVFEDDKSADTYEDISSFTVPQSITPEENGFSFTVPDFDSSDEADEQVDADAAEEEDVAEPDEIYSGFNSGIFSDDDSDEAPTNFSYQPDFDDIFDSADE